MNIVHIVGLNGTGKSTFAALMVASLESRGAKCAVVDSETMAWDYKGDAQRAVADHGHVDHLFLEYHPQTFKRAIPGDKVIRIDCWPDEEDRLAYGGVLSEGIEVGVA